MILFLDFSQDNLLRDAKGHQNRDGIPDAPFSFFGPSFGPSPGHSFRYAFSFNGFRFIFQNLSAHNGAHSFPDSLVLCCDVFQYFFRHVYFNILRGDCSIRKSRKAVLCCQFPAIRGGTVSGSAGICFNVFPQTAYCCIRSRVWQALQQ